MTVHEVSALTGVSIRALRYYDEIGLLPPAKYTEAGYRLYDDAALERLQQILLFRALEFPLKGKGLFVLEHSWVPMQKIYDNREKLDWEMLIKTGRLTAVDNEYVEYEDVLAWFLAMREQYRIQTIGYDPAKAFRLVQEMQLKGFTMNPVRQGELTLTAPLDDLQERFLDGDVVHNNDPLFNWYLGNVKVKKRSENGTYLPTKQNKNRKIDGFAALLDAHTEFLRQSSNVIPPEKKVSRVIDV